jgi:DNA replication protein DnaC
MKKNCKDCGIEFEASDDALIFRYTVYCSPCLEKSSKEAKEKAEKDLYSKRVYEWRGICPPAYLETVKSKLPNPSKIDEVMAWEYGKNGILLHGKTRTGKSRCAWALCHKVFFSGKTVKILDTAAGFKYAAVFSSGGREVNEWIGTHSRCGLLFLDDVFKAKLTDSFEAAIFAILDYRMNHNLPILATLNDTGDTLAARMSPDRGDALVARLKEMCATIQF